MRKRINRNLPFNIRSSEVTVEYTNGKEYVYYDIMSNAAKEYFGFYYELKSGQVYMGSDFNISPRVELYRPPKSSFNEKNKMYHELTNDAFDRYSYPIYHYPEPTTAQYDKGTISREFVQKRNEKDIIVEIDPESNQLYNNSNDPGINAFLWEKHSLSWTISGDIKQVRKANQRVLEKANQTFPGILNYLGDLDEFHISKPIIKKQRNRSLYPDGEAINGNLPQGYNQAAIPGQNCASCIFKNNNHCGVWQANIRNNYVCMRWKLKPY
tara:strand:+ start:552 stop:1355 length:804 start_codon:yes stop_codon:yes gene_type:complete